MIGLACLKSTHESHISHPVRISEGIEDSFLVLSGFFFLLRMLTSVDYRD